MTTAFKLRKKLDTRIPVLTLVLSVFGLVMILSSSQISASESSGNPYYFFIRQLIAWVLGVGAFFYFLQVPIEVLYHNRTKFVITTLVLLLLVFVPIIGPEIAGVHRWVNLGFFQLQSAEVAKLFLTIYFASWLAEKGDNVQDPIKGLVPFITLLVLVVGLVMLQPDLGTTLVLIIIAMTIFFVAQANLWQYGALVIAGFLAILLLIHGAGYRSERLNAFLHRGTEQSDTQGSAYHSHQALIAIGSGGLWGVGFGQGISKHSYLPQSHTDSIFAVIAEELGFIRTMLVVAAYFYLTWRGYLIAKRANSRFVQYLATGITVSILAQALINIGGMLNLIPLTGVPLPLISYGGSSLIITMASLGLLTNISKETT